MELSLVYHAGALGDFLTTLPAMRAWRRLHPADRIVLLGKSELAELAPRGLFDDTWEARSSFFAPLFSGNREAPSPPDMRMRGFQSALLFSSASSRLPASLKGLGLQEIIQQEPLPTGRMHAVDYHLGLFPGLTFTLEDRVPQISRAGNADAVSPGTAALHPGSGNPRKNWPLEKFRALAAGLEQAGLSVRWVLGPAEAGLMLPAGAEAWRNVRLADIAASLAACDLFVGNDSGVTHLSAAAGCATVALFGATDPAVWTPRGRCVRVITAPEGTLEALSVDSVLSECCDVLRR